MIQKLREKILGKKENRESFLAAAIIILVGPALIYIFNFFKTPPSVMLAVNSEKIDKRIFQIKIYEQRLLLERIQSIFGNNPQIMQYLYGGMSPEQFVLQQVIKNALLAGMFKKSFFIKTRIFDSFFAKKAKSGPKTLAPFIGEFLANLFYSDGNTNLNNDVRLHFGISIQTVEVYSLDLMSAYFMEKIINSVFQSIALSVIANHDKNFIDTISFDVYSKKIVPNKENGSMIGDNQKISRYHEELAKGNFYSTLDAEVEYVIARDISNDSVRALNAVFQSANDYDSLESVFLAADCDMNKYKSKKAKLTFSNDKVLCDQGDISDVAEGILSGIMQYSGICLEAKNKKDFIIVLKKSIKEPEAIPFDQVSDKVVELILFDNVLASAKSEANVMRAGKEINTGWISSKKVISQSKESKFENSNLKNIFALNPIVTQQTGAISFIFYNEKTKTLELWKSNEVTYTSNNLNNDKDKMKNISSLFSNAFIQALISVAKIEFQNQKQPIDS